jgi:hypothetical protein
MAHSFTLGNEFIMHSSLPQNNQHELLTEKNLPPFLGADMRGSSTEKTAAVFPGRISEPMLELKGKKM